MYLESLASLQMNQDKFKTQRRMNESWIQFGSKHFLLCVIKWKCKSYLWKSVLHCWWSRFNKSISEKHRLPRKHLQDTEEEEVFTLWRRWNGVNGAVDQHWNHPRPRLSNRLLEELNCAQLMHNKQMELNAIAPERRLYLVLSASPSLKCWNKSELCFFGVGAAAATQWSCGSGSQICLSERGGN